MIKAKQRTTGETALEEARRIANYLLTQLPAETRETFTSRAQAAGIRWLGATVVVYADDREIPTVLAAELAGVSPATITQWANTAHPLEPGRMLLPKHGRDGRQNTYLVADVKAAAWIASTHEWSRTRSARKAA